MSVSLTHTIPGIPGVISLDTAPPEIWEKVTPIHISQYNWNKSEYSPRAAVKIFYTHSGFRVLFESEEEHIRAVETLVNGPVCDDSCVEFFFNPCPESTGRYVNIEINPIGVMHMAIGTERHGRELLGRPFHRLVSITTGIDSPKWRVEYTIPFVLLEALYGPIPLGPGHKMRGNFYKCGNKTRRPHFGCWNLIGTPKPDFHRPEYFGELVLGE